MFTCFYLSWWLLRARLSRAGFLRLGCVMIWETSPTATTWCWGGWCKEKTKHNNVEVCTTKLLSFHHRQIKLTTFFFFFGISVSEQQWNETTCYFMKLMKINIIKTGLTWRRLTRMGRNQQGWVQGASLFNIVHNLTGHEKEWIIFKLCV